MIPLFAVISGHRLDEKEYGGIEIERIAHNICGYKFWRLWCHPVWCIGIILSE